jgi:hypothetical protein
VHVSGLVQKETGLHGVQTLGRDPDIQVPSTHCVHWELEEVVHVTGETQPGTGVQRLHIAGATVASR